MIEASLDKWRGQVWGGGNANVVKHWETQTFLKKIIKKKCPMAGEETDDFVLPPS